MALISEELSIWELSHRWAGYDPERFVFTYPVDVKDNFKLLMYAILSGEVYCETLSLAKRPHDSKADPAYYIRTHIDDVYDCIGGLRYKKKLLKWALIGRDDFKEWCERRSIPLPEFWFPPGWKYEFEEPEFGTRAFWASHMEPDEPGGFAVRFEIPDEVRGTDNVSVEGRSDDYLESTTRMDSKKAKLCAQQMAIQLWKEFPDRTIAEMSRDEIILKYSGAANYQSGLIKWLREVAPQNVKGKPGRPRKKPDLDAE